MDAPRFEDTIDVDDAPKFEDTVDVNAPQEDNRTFTDKATDFALDALPGVGAVVGGGIGALAGGGIASIPGAAAGGAGGYMLGSDARDIIGDFMGRSKNPIRHGMDRVKEVAGNATKGAVIGGSGPALRGAVSSAPAIVDGLATSPVPQQLAKATDIAGRVGSPVFGRFGAYATPGVKYVQGFSDSMRGVEGIQKGMTWVLDNMPQALGKYAPMLQRIAEQGGKSAVATTDFLLTQKDPEYQEMKKRMHE